jgi:hypothetical protein
MRCIVVRKILVENPVPLLVENLFMYVYKIRYCQSTNSFHDSPLCIFAQFTAMCIFAAVCNVHREALHLQRACSRKVEDGSCPFESIFLFKPDRDVVCARCVTSRLVDDRGDDGLADSNHKTSMKDCTTATHRLLLAQGTTFPEEISITDKVAEYLQRAPAPTATAEPIESRDEPEQVAPPSPAEGTGGTQASTMKLRPLNTPSRLRMSHPNPLLDGAGPPSQPEIKSSNTKSTTESATQSIQSNTKDVHLNVGRLQETIHEKSKRKVEDFQSMKDSNGADKGDVETRYREDNSARTVDTAQFQRNVDEAMMRMDESINHVAANLSPAPNSAADTAEAVGAGSDEAATEGQLMENMVTHLRHISGNGVHNEVLVQRILANLRRIIGGQGN